MAFVFGFFRKTFEGGRSKGRPRGEGVSGSMEAGEGMGRGGSEKRWCEDLEVGWMMFKFFTIDCGVHYHISLYTSVG